MKHEKGRIIAFEIGDSLIIKNKTVYLGESAVEVLNTTLLYMNTGEYND